MKITHTEILIIGAGPAGCSVARELKDEDVILVDKNTLPRDKPCSGLLVEESKAVLNSLGIPKSVFGNPPELDLEHIDIDNGIDVIQKKALGNTDRIKLDDWLASLIGKNVELLQNTTVSKIEPHSDHVNVFILSDEGEQLITAKKVVGADGASSTTRRLLGIKPVPRYRTSQNFIKTTKQIQNCKFIYWNELTDWYSWVLPKEEGIIEVGGAFKLKTDNDLALKRLMKHMEISGEIIKKAHWILSRPLKQQDIYLGNGSNIFMVGEAAGFISPSTGEGISFGLRSGVILARALSTKNIFSEYTTNIQQIINEIDRKITKAKTLSDQKHRPEVLNLMK